MEGLSLSVVPARAKTLFGSQWREAIVRTWPGWEVYRDDFGLCCATWYASLSDADFAHILSIADEDADRRLLAVCGTG